MLLSPKPFIKFCTLLACSLLLFSGCKKTEQAGSVASTLAEITNFSLSSDTGVLATSFGINHIKAMVPASVTDGNNLTAMFTLSAGAHATINDIPQQSGITQNNFSEEVSYVVHSAANTQKTWYVDAVNNEHSLDWGLGHFVSKSVSLNRDYEWYIDQGNTGIFASSNCGPTSVTMAIKWADPDFTGTALDARSRYESSGGWWYTDDVDNYLTDNNIPHAAIPLNANAQTTSQLLTAELDKSQILILCIDMNRMRSSSDASFHVDRFYDTTPNWGHFFVVKGYQVIDGEVYFQVYDPNSLGLTNADDYNLKGRNRFYRYEDVAAATFNWWNYAFVISKKGDAINLNTLQKAVNPATLPRAHSF